MSNITEWYTGHAKRLDKKYYTALMTPDTMFKVYAKRGYKISSWEEAEVRSYVEKHDFLVSCSICGFRYKHISDR